MSLNLAFSIGCEIEGDVTYKSGSPIAFKDMKISFDFSELSKNELDEVFCVDSVTAKVHNSKVHLVVRPVKCEEHFSYSYVFKIIDFDNALLVDLDAIDLEYPLVILDKQTFETDLRALGDMPDVILGNSSDIDSGSRHRLPNESGPEVEISFVSFDPLFDIKQIILSSDKEKGTKKGEKILQECSESNAITFQVKSLIKRRIVNYLVKQYTYFPPKNVKQNLAECVAGQLFQNLRLEQQRDIVLGLGDATSFLDIYSHNIYYESLFILLISGRGVKICVKGLGLLPNNTESYDCKIADDGKILAHYGMLTPLQEIWMGSYFPSNRKLRYLIPTSNLPHPSLNPFDGKTSTSMPLYMAVILVKTGRNATLILQQSWYDDPHVEVETNLYIFHTAGMLSEFTYSTGYQFLSCYGDSYITFDFYVTPFQPAVWLGLLSSLLLTFMVLSVYMFWKHKRSAIGLFLSFLSLFFEDFTPVRKYMANTFFYRILFSSLGFVAVLLTNCYTGIMITELNAPLQQSRPETFQQLICQDKHILSSNDSQDIARWAKDSNLDLYWGKSNMMKPYNPNVFASDSCFRMLSTPTQTPSSATYFWYTHLVNKYSFVIKKLLKEFQLNKETTAEIRKPELFYLLLLNPVHNFLPSGFNFTNRWHTTTELQELVERDITICKKKTALIGTTELIEGEMDFLTKSYPSKKFYSGSDLLEEKRSGWKFLGGGRSPVSRSISPVHQRFKALVHSGIYSRLKREMARNMWKQRRPVVNDTSNIISSMGMNGRLVTLFVICGALFSAPFIVFLAEIRNYAWNFVYFNVYRTFQSCCGKL
ncbi:hypothetical protein Fcan01_28140 [Folsomia candida]|uniref:Uncharacterized protein n=1 Tax=Folsomia candida TaxID=158441 RepID=A0A226CUJ0_FOLCA|nr:hypothetical protein Fcan01_28140 [Folsomia candida]